MWLEFRQFRFSYCATEPITFPRGKPGNVLRGGFGSLLRALDRDTYTRLFEPPRAQSGPSGLREPARRFVFRAAHLDGRRVEAGETFGFGFHLFDPSGTAEVLTAAFAQLGREGLGHSRGRAALTTTECKPMRIGLEAADQPVPGLRIEFVTPTELKSGDRIVEEPAFAVVLARARDRVSMLAAVSGSAPAEIDFRQLGEHARAVTMTRSDIRTVRVMRRSARTGQRHSLGGFTGRAKYEGELRQFLPWLHAAQFTGVGRHAAWGQGEIRIEVP